jgi:acyl-CoA hydrolase
VEVDFLGQANAEMINGRQISSAGGLTDFMRGARLSPGGFSVVALTATAKGGAVSRIVPALGAETAVSAARGDVDYVVTEYGIADLRYSGIDGRAEALIAIAAPQFRHDLHAAWRQRRNRM